MSIFKTTALHWIDLLSGQAMGTSLTMQMGKPGSERLSNLVKVTEAVFGT
jgi:hypothetical protein